MSLYFKNIILVASTLLILFSKAVADEGMWLPVNIEKYIIEQMQAKGCKLSYDEIYSDTSQSLKDAIIGLVNPKKPFSNFCTGEIVSSEGLFITNHHCSEKYIQSLSSVNSDYLKNGFTAMNHDEELPNSGLAISVVKRMENVTNKIFRNIPDSLSDFQKKTRIEILIDSIETNAVKDTHYKAKVSSHLAGNEYYLTVIEVFTDIRLVFAPPSSIGNYGGDTDNWMWPRHTGDFTLLRIYADTNNLPSELSEDNIPYTPDNFLKISLKGVKQGDFTFTYGFPGKTSQYLFSDAIKLKYDLLNPIGINVRTEALEIIKPAMSSDPAIKLQYFTKATKISNSWKKWTGENEGIRKYDAIAKRREFESSFVEWYKSNDSLQEKYSHIYPEYKKLYSDIKPYKEVSEYLWETLFAVSYLKLAVKINSLNNISPDNYKKIEAKIEDIKEYSEKFFRDFDPEIEKQLLKHYVSTYYNNVNSTFHPSYFNSIEKKYKGDAGLFAEYIFNNTILNNKEKFYKLLDNYNHKTYKAFDKDPAFRLFVSARDMYYSQIEFNLSKHNNALDKLNKDYMEAIMSYSKKPVYSDANSTLRISYGTVENLKPADATTYHFQTTLKGVIEKEDAANSDFNVPARLKELYKNQDYSIYPDSAGFMPVCFIATNHTTGGNSGSPVLNSEGKLIGVNFDRNYEGTMADLMYEPEKCRNIAVDIRYILFIIDKYAGSKHIIDELTMEK